MEILCGPRTHVCWTPDGTPRDQQEQVVLIRYADFMAARGREQQLNDALRYLVQQAKLSDLGADNGAMLHAERVLDGDGDGIMDTVRDIVREFREHQARRYGGEPIPHLVAIPGTSRQVDNQVGVRVQLLTDLADRVDPQSGVK